MAEEKIIVREQACSVHRVIDYGQTILLFKDYAEQPNLMAEKLIDVVQEVFLQIVPMEEVAEVSLIITARLFDLTHKNLLSVQCVLRMALDQLDRPGAKDDIMTWKTMRLATRSIGELMTWSNSFYNSGKHPVAPVKDELGTIRPVDHIWTFDDLSVMQLRTYFGCLQTSFQVKLAERNTEQERRLSRTMLHVMSCVLSNVMRDPIVPNGNMFLMAEGDEFDMRNRKTAKEIVMKRFSVDGCRH